MGIKADASVVEKAVLVKIAKEVARQREEELWAAVDEQAVRDSEYKVGNIITLHVKVWKKVEQRTYRITKVKGEYYHPWRGEDEPEIGVKYEGIRVRKDGTDGQIDRDIGFYNVVKVDLVNRPEPTEERVAEA